MLPIGEGGSRSASDSCHAESCFRTVRFLCSVMADCAAGYRRRTVSAHFGCLSESMWGGGFGSVGAVRRVSFVKPPERSGDAPIFVRRLQTAKQSSFPPCFWHRFCSHRGGSRQMSTVRTTARKSSLCMELDVMLGHVTAEAATTAGHKASSN